MTVYVKIANARVTEYYQDKTQFRFFLKISMIPLKFQDIIEVKFNGSMNPKAWKWVYTPNFHQTLHVDLVKQGFLLNPTIISQYDLDLDELSPNKVHYGQVPMMIRNDEGTVVEFDLSVHYPTNGAFPFNAPAEPLFPDVPEVHTLYKPAGYRPDPIPLFVDPDC